MSKEPFMPIDLGHIQDKARLIKHRLEIYTSSDRSEEMKKKCLKDAEQLAETLVRDIDYYLDAKLFDGRRAMGLDELE